MKRKLISLFILFTFLLTIFCQVGCSTTVKVDFVVDGIVEYTYSEVSGVEIPLPSAPTKGGYRFEGWYLGEEEIVDSYTVGDTPVQIVARYEKAKKVDFKVGDSVYYQGSYYKGDVITFPATDPYRDGEVFVGWYLGGVKCEEGATYTVGDSDMVFVAGFANVIYTFLNYNGVELESGMVVAGESIVLPEIPSRTSYRIVGWVDSLDNLYAVGESVVINTDISFRQVYEREYTLRYRYADGTMVSDSTRYVAGETVTLPQIPHIDGKTATGWYDASSMYEVGEVYTITKQTTLVAKYVTEKAPDYIRQEVSDCYETDDPIYPHVLDVVEGVSPTLTPYTGELRDGDIVYQTSQNKNAYMTGYGMVIDGIMIEIFTFKSVPIYDGTTFVDDTIIGGVILYSANTSLGEDAPGVLQSYGGGGGINGGIITTGIKWAKEGYVYCMVDMPGVGNPNNMKLASGTHMTAGYGANRFRVSPSVEASSLYMSVSSAIKGFSILYNSGLVNKEKVGTFGVSWGGYMTTYLAGALGSMLQVSSSTYGSGYFEYEGNFKDSELAKMSATDRALWLKYLDAGRRASGVKGYYFVGAATNDTWFRPPMIEATLEAMTNARGLGWFYDPNQNHTLPNVPGGTNYYTRGKGNMQVDTLLTDYYLCGKGYAPPTIEVSEAPHKNDDGDMQMDVTFTTDARCGLNTEYIKAYYAKQPTTGTTTPWLDKVYKDITSHLTLLSQGEGVYVYRLVIPAEIAHLGVDFFVTIGDSGDDKDSRTFSLSTHMLNSSGLGIEYDGELSDEDAGIVQVRITNDLGEYYTTSLLKQGMVHITLIDPIYSQYSSCRFEVVYMKNGEVKKTESRVIMPTSSQSGRTISLEVSDHNGLEVPPADTTLIIKLLDTQGNPIRIAKEIRGM